jgi:RHS repeat-associated protein
MSYDPENRLTSIGATLTAGYRADGKRAWKQTAAGRTYFLYDGDVLLCELDAAGAVTATNTWGTNGLVSRREGTVSDYYVFDPQGNVAQKLGAAGGVKAHYTFDAFGVGATNVAVSDPYGYKAQWGYYTDRETGLLLLTHRYYDPGTGRFVTRDPISYAGGINVYGYVGNDSVNWADPLGLMPAKGNWKMDPAQVERVEQEIKDIIARGNRAEDRKRLNELKEKLKRHQRAVND